MLIPSPEDLAHALDDAGSLQIIRIGHLEKRKIYVTADWQGQRLEFTASITEVAQGTIPQKTRSRALGAQKPWDVANALRQRDSWTEEQLRVAGLPLYHDPNWLRATHARLGSWYAIERTYGYSNQALADAGKRAGMSIRPHHSEEVKRQVRDLVRQGKSYRAVGHELGIPHTSVRRIINAQQKD